MTIGGVPASGSYLTEEIEVQVPPGAKTGPVVVNGVYGDAASKTDFVVTGAPVTPVPGMPDEPAVTSPLRAHATQDQPFTYQVTADRPVSLYFADNTVPGLRFDERTGIFSGTPRPSGNYHVRIGVSDAINAGVNPPDEVLTIRIAAAVPTVTLSVTPSRFAEADGQEAAFTFTLTHPATRALTIHYGVEGSFAPGAFPSLDGRVEIPAGETSASVKIFPGEPAQPSGPPTGTQKLKLKLRQTSSNIIIGKPDTAKIKIVFP